MYKTWSIIGRLCYQVLQVIGLMEKSWLVSQQEILACFTAGNKVSWIPGEFTLPTPDFSNQENEEDTIMQQ